MVKNLLLFAFFLLSVKLLAQSPLLSNFRVESSEKSRVYFDSSDPLNSITTTGFIVNEKTISSVIINTGSKTGHYFTVSSAFNFWDNNTIRLVNGNSTVEDFTLTYIENRIPEPDATGTIYYVAVNGSDSNNGTDESTPFKTIQKALKTAKAGNTVYVKAGTYVTTGSTYMRDYDGTPTNPIKVIGYKNVPGDITSMYYSFTQGSVAPALDPSEMPLMDGNNIHNSGIYVDSRDYIIIKNMQFKRYFKGIASGNNKGLLVENCVTKEMFGAGGNEEGAGISLGRQNSGSDYPPSYFRIKNSIALNSGMVNLRITGSNGLIDNCKVYSDKSGGGGTIGTDYYIDIGGDNNIIINSSAEAIDATVNPSSHGIGAKGTEWNYSDWGMHSSYNLFQNLYIKTGSQEGVYARNIRADFNVFKDCEITGFGTGNYDGIGISNQTGARNNIYERMNIHDLKSAIMFKGGTESGTSPANNVTDGNIIRNSIIKNVANVIETQRTQTIVYTFSNNKIYNCTINGAGNMLRANDSSLGYYSLSNNEIANSIFIGVSSENSGSRKPSLQEMFAIDHSNFHSGFPKPSWSTNSLSEDPKLGINLKPSLATPETIYDGGKDIPGLYFDADHFPRESGKYSMGAYDNEVSSTGSVSPDATICVGENTTLVASGGTSYLWNTGETTASITASPSSTTTYTVTVTNGSESDSHDVTVTVNQVPTVDLGADQSICYGETVTLTATGTGDFLWNTGETTASITVNPNATTTYTVTASNSCATDATDDIIVNVNPEIGLIVGNDTNICVGESTTLTATGNGDFLWSTGETTSSITVQPNSTTTYSVTSTLGACTENASILVSVSAVPTVDLGADQSICYGETVTLTATGTGDFLWNTGETTASITVNPTTTTTYSVTASNSCSTDVTDDIIINVNPEIGLTVGNDISICTGENTTLTATGNGDFLWSTGETTSSITVQPNSTTTYSVSSSLGACTENESVLVTVDVAPSVDLGSDQSICYGETVTLTATGIGNFLWSTGETTSSITVNPTTTTTYTVTASNACSDDVSDNIIVNVNPEIGLTIGNDISICTGESTTLTATGNGDFLWSTGETTSSITVQPNSTTTYTVTSSLGACSENASVIVTISDSSSVDLGSDKSICNGETVTLTATGTGNFLWSTGETTSSITVNPTTTTTYSVTASNSCSADATDDIIVNVNELPSVNAGEDTTITNGESTTLTATGNGNFLWSTGETSPSITVNPTSTTTYSVIITSDQGCINQDAVVVTVDNPESVVADAGPDQNVCPDDSDTVLTASGGDTYLWSTGETTASITVSPTVTTVYTVAVYVGNNHTLDEVTVYIDESCSNNISSEQQELKIYPNPTNGLVNIEMTGFRGDLNVSLYNLNGSVVHTENMNNSSKEKVLKSQINLSRLAKGMYFVRLNNGSQVVTKKLMVI